MSSVIVTTATATPALSGGGEVGSPVLEARPFDVRRFGAIWDGRSHPLRERFPTIERARAVYPFARSLEQQVDFCATQGAINAAAAAGGGCVWLPRGVGTMDDTLVIPEARPFGDPGTQVDMRGEVWQGTRLRWTTDLGPGRFAISFGDPAASRANRLGRYAADGMYEGLFEDFCIEGPNPPGALGAVHTRMSGLAWGARRTLRRIRVSRFYAGIDLVGDHSLWESVQTPDNFYGVYVAEPSDYMVGDNVYTKCFFTGCRMAAIAIHPRACLPSGIYIGCYIGGAPYGVMKEERNGLTNPDNRLAAGVVFDRCMFEYIGNAMLEDRNFRETTATAISDLVDVQFRGLCYFQWQDGNRIPAHPRRAIWNVGGLERVLVQGWGATFAFVPGDDCLLRVGRIENAALDLRWSEVFANLAKAGRPVFDASVTAAYSGRHATWQEGTLQGGFFAMTGPDSGGRVGKDEFVQLQRGAAARVSDQNLPLGVAQMAAEPGRWIGIATWGGAVRCRLAGPVTEGSPVFSNGTGAAVVMAGRQEGDLIGHVVRALESGYAEIALKL
ncbi:hypothetical protein [Roseomonas indoligenes]|uniref:Uncharacterized protein n=1 Tax=Roseomonas indoligenes TaxID=2820811 RepID=A0A940N1I9_9PROT|nr:hypothetical protein [Pararoseomonas indoligenes]MBP0496236.1 hypothetical protein [Pararoseomonas indoligenes]